MNDTPAGLLPALPPSGPARRHLAMQRARLRGRSWPAPAGGIVLLGATGTALTLAAALARRGRAVTVAEPDAASAARLAEQVRRRGLSVAVGRARPALCTAGLVIETRDHPRAPALLAAALARAPAGAAGAILSHGPGQGPRLRMVVPGLVEVFAGDAAPLAGLAAALGCVPLVLPPGAEGPGARLLWRMEATAEALCFAGLAPWDLDAAAEGAGFAEGPGARMDRLGLDSALARRRRLGPAGAEPGVIARMVAEGRLGRKASVGWARYPGGGGRVTDPLIEDLVREEAHFARRPALAIPPQAAVAALVLALVDEAAALLAEGQVGGAGQIDLAAVLACGFPVALGGAAHLLAQWGPAAAPAYAALATRLPGVLPPPRGLDRAPVPGDTQP
jgi:hypothetical protein